MSSTVFFFITDLIYRKDNSNNLTILGRSEKGKKLQFLAEFNPYFWIDFKSRDIEKKLTDLNIKVSYKAREVAGSKKELIKAEFNSPEHLVESRREIREISEINGIYEYDIPFRTRFLIDNKIKQFHKCKAEVEGDKIISIECSDKKMEPKLLAYDIETEYEITFPTPKKDRIIYISFYGTDNFKKVITWKRFKTKHKYVEFVFDERELIKRAKEVFEEFDPDLVVGYNSDKFDLPFLTQRGKENNINFELGWINEIPFSGISNMDALISIRKIMGQNLRTNRYDLNSVAKEMLGLKKADFDPKVLNKLLTKVSDEDLEKVAEYNLVDSELTFKLLKNILPALFEINDRTNIFLDESSKMNYGMMVEWFLINQHFNAGKIIPNRPSYRDAIERERKRAKGAFVFEPSAGLYENLHVMDFRSLYPSIIITHKISPAKTNFIPDVLRQIVYERKKIKSALTSKFSKEANAKQFTLKILANAFYGYFGFAQSRWYSFEAVSDITAYGRKYIKEVIEKAKKEFNVIYGDTDSIFLQTDKSQKEVKEFVKKINDSLQKDLELEYEQFYKTGIFLSKKNETGGAKKRYALMDAKGNLLIKGLEAIRGDWSNIAKSVQIEVIKKILSQKKPEAALEYVKETIAKLRRKEIPLDDLIIRTRILKQLNQYKVRGPHISAAKLYENLGEKVGAGFMVSYVVCKGPAKNISDRIKLPEQANINEIDEDYYIEHQIVRAVFKIFELFDIPVKEISKKQKSLNDWK